LSYYCVVGEVPPPTKDLQQKVLFEVVFMSDSIRLAKRVAELFNCSRGEATLYIEGAAVTVDGVVVEEPGYRVTGQEQIALLPDAALH
jgi:RNA-binding protein YlmH